MPVRLPAPVPTTAQAGESLVGRLVTWATDRPEEPAYTFVDYLVEPGGRPQTLTWAQLDRRVRTLAGRLRQMTAPGDRVAVLAPSGLDYVVALYAAWYAGAVAVPLFAPGLPGHAERLVAAYDDARRAACSPSRTPPPRYGTSSQTARSRRRCSSSTRPAIRRNRPRTSRSPSTSTRSPTCSTPPVRPGRRPVWRSPIGT